MKLNRSQFKSLIKECIKELVEEGVFKVPGRSLNEHDQIAQAMEVREGMRKNLKLEQAAMEMARQVAKGKSEKEAKLYEHIFADTAETTLQKRLAMELGSNPGTQLDASPEQIVASEKELDQFEGAGRWAQVAFSSRNKSVSSN